MRTVVTQDLISATSNRLNHSASGVRQTNRRHLPSTSSQNSSPPSTASHREHKSSTTLLAQGPMVQRFDRRWKHGSGRPVCFRREQRGHGSAPGGRSNTSCSHFSRLTRASVRPRFAPVPSDFLVGPRSVDDFPVASLSLGCDPTIESPPAVLSNGSVEFGPVSFSE